MKYGEKCQQRYGHTSLRWAVPFLSITIFTGCGSNAAQPSMVESNNVAVATQPMPTALVEPTASPESDTQVMSTSLIVPEETVTVEIDGVEWQLAQPHGEEPLVAADSQGILWVRFPPLETGKQDVEQAGLIPRHPVDSYRIMYTPQQPKGGSLEQNAEEVFEIPHQVESDEDDLSQIQYITQRDTGKLFFAGNVY